MIEVVYQDDSLLVVDKPAGMVVFSDRDEESLINHLIERFPQLKSVGEWPRYGAIHRLDKETSGVLLVAKDDNSLSHFQKQFQELKVVKEYIALVYGTIKEKEGTIETLIGRAPSDRRKQKAYPLSDTRIERRAISEYRVLKKFKNYTLIRVILVTGRKHQIRCHMAHLHHPIVGDKLYSFKNQSPPKELKRQFLHAERVIVKNLDGKELAFSSPLPKELKEILDNLIKNE